MIQPKTPTKCAPSCDEDDGCVFEYDTIYCAAYERSIVNVPHGERPDWCKVSAIFIMEARPDFGEGKR